MEVVCEDSGGGLDEGGHPPPAQGSASDISEKIVDDVSGDVTQESEKTLESESDKKDSGQSGNDGENNCTNGKRSNNLEMSDSAMNGKRKRHRRKQKGGGRHHRKWKPYDKLTWEEKKILEELETKRACKKRETRFASGQAMAPYNTTQFLMEQHQPLASEFHLGENHHHDHTHRTSQERALAQKEADNLSGNVSFSGGSGDGSSDSYDSNDEEIFLEKDFTEAYEQYQSEKLESMTKEELVREHMQLQGEVDSLKKQLNEERRRSSGSSHGPLDIRNDDISSIQVFELVKQVRKLKEENGHLKIENQHLAVAAQTVKPIEDVGS